MQNADKNHQKDNKMNKYEAHGRYDDALQQLKSIENRRYLLGEVMKELSNELVRFSEKSAKNVITFRALLDLFEDCSKDANETSERVNHYAELCGKCSNLSPNYKAH